MTITFNRLLLLSVMVLVASAAFAQSTALPESNVQALTPKPVPTMKAPVTSPGEMAKRQALVSQYITPEKYDSLYETVVDQYITMSPNNTNMASLKEDIVFRDQIFSLVQQRATKTFTLSELEAMKGFVDSPQGARIASKVNSLGLQFRQKDLDEDERAALRNFSQSPEGKTIAAKSVGFASGSLGEVMRSVLVRQAMSGGL